MTNTPTPRPDVEGINSFIRDTLHHASSFASQYEGDDSVFHKQSIEAYDKFPALIEYIKALEARMEKLGMFVRMARERGQLENAIAYLDENGPALGDGDG